MKKLLLLGAALFGVTGCPAPVVSETIDGMRVLAIRAEPPTAIRGEKVRLEALVVTGKENPRVDITWFVCTLEVEDCVKSDLGDEGIVVVGNGPVAIVEVPMEMLIGETLLLWMDARAAGKGERSLKGIYIRPETEPPNANPNLDRVRWGGDVGAPIVTAKKEERVNVFVDSSEMFNEIWLEAGEPASEDVRINTYVTQGSLVDPSGTMASGALYFDAPAKKARVGTWIVVNDDRGGVDWFEHWLDVEGKLE